MLMMVQWILIRGPGRGRMRLMMAMHTAFVTIIFWLFKGVKFTASRRALLLFVDSV